MAIDAGHGGKDPGAVSKDMSTYEKTLTLDIAKRLQTLILSEYPEMKVVLTRKNDSFVSLQDRADIANKADADLFISIHINSARSTAPNGFSMHVLGQSNVRDRDLFAYNMDVCRRENSVMLLEDDYSTKYQGFDPSDPESFIFMQLMQNAYLEQSLVLSQKVGEEMKNSPIRENRGVWQNPFYVLWRTSMPAVLVELGFISNSADLKTLRGGENRQKIAECLFKAFASYKKSYDRSISVPQETSPSGNASQEPAPDVKPAPDTTSVVPPPVKDIMPKIKVRYGTQIMAGRKRIPDGDKAFLGYTPEIIKVGDLYKYIIGVEDTPDRAKESYRKIKSTYGDAFLVTLYGQQITKFQQ